MGRIIGVLYAIALSLIIIMIESSAVGAYAVSTDRPSSCAEDSVLYRQDYRRGPVWECVPLDAMTDDSRAYGESWVIYCGSALARHHGVLMTFDDVGRIIGVRCVRHRP